MLNTLPPGKKAFLNGKGPHCGAYISPISGIVNKGLDDPKSTEGVFGIYSLVFRRTDDCQFTGQGIGAVNPSICLTSGLPNNERIALSQGPG